MKLEKIKHILLNYCDSIWNDLISLLAVVAEKPCNVNGGSPFLLKATQRVTGVFFTLHLMPLYAHFRCNIGDVKYAYSGEVLELTSPVLRVYEDQAAAANSFHFRCFLNSKFSFLQSNHHRRIADSLTMDALVLSSEMFSKVTQSIMMHYKSLILNTNPIYPSIK